jgi:hypothetical protein
MNICKLIFNKDYKSSEDEIEGWSCCNKVFETKKGATCHENLYCKNKKYKNKDYKSSEDEIEGWSCSYCNKVFETKKGATCHENLYCKNKKYKNKDYKSSKNNKCYRCGRYGHYSNECYANKHINGYYLDN